MRRGDLRSPAAWLFCLALAAGAGLVLTTVAPQAQARRPKARAAAQAGDRPSGKARAARGSRRGGSARRARKGRASKAKGAASAASRSTKRVGKTGLVRLKYTVQPGDTLSRVARKLHVTVDQLRWWNRWLRKGSSLRAGARVAYLVKQSELDRREAQRHKAARAAHRRTGHRRAAKVARDALVRTGDDASRGQARGPKDVRSLRVARATPAELGKAPKPHASVTTSGSTSGTTPGSRRDKARAASNQEGAPAPHAAEQPPAPTPPADPPADAPRAAVAKVAGAARGVVATVAASTGGEQEARVAPSPARDEAPEEATASARATGRRRTTAGDFPSYRVPAASKRAEAIGSPNGGRLRHGVEMPIRGPGFRRISTKKRFATDQTIALVRYAAARLAAQFPGTRPMLVNAMSAKGGGRVRPHHSHQNGLDVDILYFQKGNPKHPKRGNLRPNEIDYVKTWFVLETLLLTGKFNYAFTDRSFIPGLRRQARRAGWTKRALRKIFGDPSGKGRKGRIRHWSGHRDHVHIRFTCHPADKRCEHSHFY